MDLFKDFRWQEPRISDEMIKLRCFEGHKVKKNLVNSRLESWNYSDTTWKCQNIQ